MLGELAQRDDVIVLSLHVDYWDWIGWKDTFADPAFSQRQRRYAAAAGSTVVYTPQFVIGGQTQIAGAKGMALVDAIQALRSETEVLSVDEDGRLRMAEAPVTAHLVLVEIVPEAKVSIQRGENAGRSVTYHHIVKTWTDLGEWDGSSGSLDLPGVSDDAHQRVVLAQSLDAKGYPGPIVGAVRAD
jgi:hypothetical protein